MLANNLTVEDEESVQAELLELQREAVSKMPYPQSPGPTQLHLQLGEQAPERPIHLPSAPTAQPEGEYLEHAHSLEVSLTVPPQTWRKCLPSGSANVYLWQLDFSLRILHTSSAPTCI